MSHTINYSTKYPDEVERKAAALKDVKNYLGAAKFKGIAKAVHLDKTVTRKSFLFQLSMFVGIEGYPAQVWADELGLEPEATQVVKTSPDAGPTGAESACNSQPEG